MQLEVLLPVIWLGVPPRYKACKLCNPLRSLRCKRKEHLFDCSKTLLSIHLNFYQDSNSFIFTWISSYYHLLSTIVSNFIPQLFASSTVIEKAWAYVVWNSYSVAGPFFNIYWFKHAKDQINTLNLTLCLMTMSER